MIFLQKWSFLAKLDMLESGVFDEFPFCFFMNVSAPKWGLKSQKNCVLKSTLNKFFSAHVGAENVMKNRSKTHQKTLTQACDFSSKMVIFGKT